MRRAYPKKSTSSADLVLLFYVWIIIEFSYRKSSINIRTERSTNMEPIKVRKFQLGAYNKAQIEHALKCPINTHGASMRFCLPYELLTADHKMQQWTETDGKDWWRRNKKASFCVVVIIMYHEEHEYNLDPIDPRDELDRVAS